MCRSFEKSTARRNIARVAMLTELAQDGTATFQVLSCLLHVSTWSAVVAMCHMTQGVAGGGKGGGGWAQLLGLSLYIQHVQYYTGLMVVLAVDSLNVLLENGCHI